jgi:hypothetical protein
MYHYASNDDPTEDLAIVWEFPDADTIWVDLLVIDGTMYIPEIHW